MEIYSIVLIAFGLSFDTFAVSISTGIIINKIVFKQAIRVAIIMAFFQGLMPLIGWTAGNQVAHLIRAYDHWAAFALLLILGLKMIYESLVKQNEGTNFNPLLIKNIILAAVATSIDALVVGISFAFIEINLYLSILIIGFVTFIAAMLGMLFGKNVSDKLGKKMEILGGIILICIGIKIICEHL